MAKKKAKGSWVVVVEKTVRKQLIVEGCTEAQARDDPYGHVIDERELDVVDWDVKSVEPNE